MSASRLTVILLSRPLRWESRGNPQHVVQHNHHGEEAVLSDSVCEWVVGQWLSADLDHSAETGLCSAISILSLRDRSAFCKTRNQFSWQNNCKILLNDFWYRSQQLSCFQTCTEVRHFPEISQSVCENSQSQLLQTFTGTLPARPPGKRSGTEWASGHVDGVSNRIDIFQDEKEEHNTYGRCRR